MNWKAEVFKELGYWLLFSVVMALAQLWLLPCFYYLVQRPWTWIELAGNGGLLFFATTITSKTAGEYFRKVKSRSEFGTLLCIGLMLIIIVVSVFAYALVTATRLGVVSTNSLSPTRVATMSDFLAISSMMFSASFTLIIRFSEK